MASVNIKKKKNLSQKLQCSGEPYKPLVTFAVQLKVWVIKDKLF